MNPGNVDALTMAISAKAREKTCAEKHDDYNPGDNGNYDDAFSDGSEDGEILFARELVQKFKLVGWNDK